MEMIAEWRLVNKWGKQYLECRFTNEKWNGWLFPVSKEKKPNYIWMEEFQLWRRNRSI